MILLEKTYRIGVKNPEDKPAWIKCIQEQIEKQKTKAEFQGIQSDDIYKSARFSGWLKKQGIKETKNWKKRFFALKGQSLFYFSAEGINIPKGSMPLKSRNNNPEEDYHIEMCKLQKNGIELRHEKERCYFLCAESEAEMQCWINALRDIINISDEVMLTYMFNH